MMPEEKEEEKKKRRGKEKKKKMILLLVSFRFLSGLKKKKKGRRRRRKARSERRGLKRRNQVVCFLCVWSTDLKLNQESQCTIVTGYSLRGTLVSLVSFLLMQQSLFRQTHPQKPDLSILFFLRVWLPFRRGFLSLFYYVIPLLVSEIRMSSDY